MEKHLILKILGKKDGVGLDDAIYNLREISDDLREVVLFKITIDEDFKVRKNCELKAISKIITPISEKLKDDSQINGYTNSRRYLSKYIDDIKKNIDGIIYSMEPFDIKNFTNYTNMLIDCILSY